MAHITIPKGTNRRGSTDIAALMSSDMEKVLNRILLAADKESRKLSKKERERREAIAETIDDWLGFLAEDGDEETLTAFFIQLELLASSKNRRRIAGHPLRPQAANPVVEKELDRREAERERARQDREAAAEAAEAAAPKAGETAADE